jgi:uncharacterized protein
LTLRDLQVPALDLLRRPGVQRRVRCSAELDDLAISSARVPAGAEVDVDVVVEAVGEDIVAAGVLAAPWVGLCRRCLTDVDGVVQADVREIFQRRWVEGETYPLGDGIVDLSPMVRDAILLALPLAPLCGDQCPGPDPERFPASGDPSGDEARRDPRWAALDELKFDEPDNEGGQASS